MLVTRDWIFEHRTPKGAWKRIQLEAIGVSWPPREGWIKRVVGTEITDSQRAQFELGKGSAREIIPVFHDKQLSPAQASLALAEKLPQHPTLGQVQKFEQFIGSLPQYRGETHHYFTEGVYTRVWLQHAHTVVVGKIHRKSHALIVMSGDISISTNAGIQRVQAPYIEEATAGIKRIVVAHTDAVIANVHPNPTNTRDLGELERDLIVDPDTIIDA